MGNSVSYSRVKDHSVRKAYINKYKVMSKLSMLRSASTFSKLHPVGVT